jgi:hypothetical protein
MQVVNSRKGKHSNVWSTVSAREKQWLTDEDVNRPTGCETRNETMARSVVPTMENSLPRCSSRGNERLAMVLCGGILVRLVDEA